MYTEDEGLPFFDCAAVTVNGYWYYASALGAMRGNESFCCHLVNIGLNYIPYSKRVKVVFWPQKIRIGNYF